MKKILSLIISFILLFTSTLCANAGANLKVKNNGNKFIYKNFYRTPDEGGFNKKISMNTNSYHLGWELGQFVLDGYTQKIKGKDGIYTFEKNAGDNISLYFDLFENINKLNGNKKLIIDKLDQDTDIDYNLKESNYGKGLLIIKKKDLNTSCSEPVKIYKNFLKKKDKNRKIELKEEADYEISLDYRVTETSFIDTSENYKIKFKFRIINSNTTIYPKDLNTGLDLTNDSSTENGFYVDFAGAKGLEVYVKHKIINQDKDNWHILSNEAVKDKQEFCEDGCYEIKVINNSTNADPTYYNVYVGKDNILKDFAENKYITPEDFEKLDFNNMSDKEYEEVIKDLVYKNLIDQIDTNEYFISDISTQRVSQEYLQQVEANNEENIIFTKTTSELENMEDNAYFFDVDDSGNTIIQEISKDDVHENSSLRTVINNISIGAGVIMVTASIGLLTTTSAPALSVICLVGAKSGLIGAMSTGAISTAISGTANYVKTKNLAKSAENAIVGGSEDFKIAAIACTATGGIAKWTNLLSGTKGGLKLKNVAQIQKETKWSNNTIKQIGSMEEYNVYKKNKLVEVKVGDKNMLVPSNLKKILLTDENLSRVEKGLAPLDANGKPYELHHMLQKQDSTLAILSDTEHAKIPNKYENKSKINRKDFAKIRRKIWKKIYELYK